VAIPEAKAVGTQLSMEHFMRAVHPLEPKEPVLSLEVNREGEAGDKLT
jgi:hypothetical protein